MKSSIVYERDIPPARIVSDEVDPLRAFLWLSGEVDAECAAALEAELAAQRKHRRRAVRVDTYGVTFMNSAALDVLRHAHEEWLAMRGTLVLVGVTGPTARLLRVTGLDRELLSMPATADVTMTNTLTNQPRSLVSVN